MAAEPNPQKKRITRSISDTGRGIELVWWIWYGIFGDFYVYLQIGLEISTFNPPSQQQSQPVCYSSAWLHTEGFYLSFPAGRQGRRPTRWRMRRFLSRASNKQERKVTFSLSSYISLMTIILRRGGLFKVGTFYQIGNSIVVVVSRRRGHALFKRCWYDTDFGLNASPERLIKTGVFGMGLLFFLLTWAIKLLNELNQVSTEVKWTKWTAVDGIDGRNNYNL